MKNLSFISTLRNWLIRGALFIIPIWLCAVVVSTLYSICETWLGTLTAKLVSLFAPTSFILKYFPDGHIPGLSLFTAAILLALLGAISSWHIGRQGLRIIDYAFLAIPGLNSIYSSVRKLIDTIGEPGQSRFQKVVFIEWPNKGIKAIGFVTNELKAENGTKKYYVFIPQMPNPTSGFIVLADSATVQETNLTPEEGFRLAMSLGVLTPNS